MSNTPSYSGRGGGRGSRANTGSPQTYGSPNFQPRDYNSPDFQPRDYSSPNFTQFSNRRGRNSRYFNSYSRSPHHRRGNSHHGSRNHERQPENAEDREQFVNSLVHWSMTEEPWEKLREKLKRKNSKLNQNESPHDISDSGITNHQS